MMLDIRRGVRPAMLAGVFCAIVFSGAFSGTTFAFPGTAHAAGDARLRAAIASPARTPKYAARDRYRHPYRVLRFFGIRPDMTVVEIWPGHRGWWTEILVPYLRGSGHYVAVQNTNAKEKYPDRPGISMVVSDFSRDVDIRPTGGADMVLTFRNLHNWMKHGDADRAFRSFYRALKPGGVLGLVDHRAATDKPQDPKALSGYVREDYAIALAEKAGFRLVAKSEVNANPKDTKDYPAGVWTLPPSYRLKDKDRARYTAIGESDRFTLKFVKPAN